MKKLFLVATLLLCLSVSSATTFDSLRVEQLQTKHLEQSTLQLTAVGDIMFHLPQVNSAYDSESGTYAFEDWFSYVTPIFTKRDFVIGNLETTLASEPPYRGYPGFRSPVEVAADLKASGFNVLTTANNHSYDTGFTGVVKTIEALDASQIAHIGTHKSNETPPYILLEKKGMKVALFAYTYSTNGITVPSDKKFSVSILDSDQMLKDLKQKPKNVDFTIVSLHFGNEYQRIPHTEQVRVVELLRKNGVDVILGSHPHVLQHDQLSEKKDFYVIYSMGNFISNQRDRYKDSGVIVNLDLSIVDGQKQIKTALIPTWVDKDTAYRIIPLTHKHLYLKSHLTAADRTKMKQVIADFITTFETWTFPN